MVRPAASKSNKELILHFANMVTYPTENAVDWIARTGNVSVYAAFAQCCASCVRIEKKGPNDGIAQIEANKVLEDAGYIRVRSRRAKPSLPSAIVGEASDGPSYYYSHRRWRNPSDSQDVAIMRQSWDFVLSKHPHVSMACTFDKVLEVVERCRNIWAIKNPVLAKKRMGGSSPRKRLSNGRFQSEDDEDASALSALEQLSSIAMKKAKLEEDLESAGHEQEEAHTVMVKAEAEAVASLEEIASSSEVSVSTPLKPALSGAGVRGKKDTSAKTSISFLVN